MSDWRGETPENRENRKPRQIPSFPRSESTAKASTTKSGWRGSAGASSAPATDQPSEDRSWLGDTSTTQTHGGGALRRSLYLTGLACLIGTAGIGIVWWMLSQGTPITYLTSVGTYGDKASELGVVPFGAHALKTFEALQSDNVRRVMPRDPDFVLKTIQSGDGWVDQVRNKNEGINKKFFDLDGTVKGGGASKNLVFYYINSILVRRSSDNKWVLVSDEDDPFSGGGLPLSDLFQRIAVATPENCFALVGLDLHLPTVVTNLGDLSFPAMAIEKEFQEFSRQSNDTSGTVKRGGRIIVALPCKEGQENWVSPELSSSVFGYFFQRGVLSFFNDPELTLESFESQLMKKVKDWVLQNRQSMQEPLVLMDEATRKQAKNLKFLWWFGAVTPQEEPPKLEVAKQTELKVRYQDLDRLWSRLQKLREGNHSQWNWNPMRWNPMRFARMESQLLLLEDIAERTLGKEEESHVAPSQSWKRRISDLTKEFDAAENEWKSERRVSLVESEMQSRIGRNRLFSFEDSQTTAQKPDDLALLFWTTVRRKASDPTERWTEHFNEGTLSQIPSPNLATPDWLELQLIRILHQEVDWSRKDQREDASKAIANCLQAFGTLQEIACHPNPELIPWVQEEVLSCDQSFLKAVDLLVANEFGPSIEECSELKRRLGTLQQRVKDLELAMLGRDRALHFAPHALATLMRMARYGVGGWTKQDIENKAKELAQIVQEGKQLQEKLKVPSPEAQIPSDLAKRIDDLEGELSELLTIWLSREKGAGHPEAIRDMRIAVRFPFLDAKSRSRYYENLSDLSLYTEKPTTTSEAFDSTHCMLPSEVSKVFVQALGPEKEDLFNAMPYTTIAQKDQRLSLMPLAGIFDSVAPKQLYENALLARTYANALGLRVLALGSWKDAYPFDAPGRLQGMLDQHYLTFQQLRLYQARWGNDPLQGREKVLEPFYYQLLANQYDAKAPGTKERDEAQKAIENLNSFRAAFDEKNSNAIRVQGPVEASLWLDATASLHQGIGLSDASSNASRITKLILGNGVPTPNKPLLVEFDPPLPRNLHLSLRGHRRIVPVESQIAAERFATNFEQDKTPATILGKVSSEKQYVVVLLDCSMSMGVNMKKAQNAVRELLKTLREQDQQGVSSQVSLMAFGVIVPKEKLKVSPFDISKAKGQELTHIVKWPSADPDACANVIHTNFMDIRTKFQELEKALDHDFVTPTHDTPLYASMVAACELLRKQPPEIPRTLIVLSDGANRVDTTNIYRDRTTGNIVQPPDNESKEKGRATPQAIHSASDMLDPLKRCNPQVYFYQISSPRSQKESEEEKKSRNEDEKQNDAFNGSLRKYNESRLKEKANDGGAGLEEQRTNFGDFDEVRDQLVRSLALPRVRIDYLNPPAASETIQFKNKNELRRGSVSVSAVRQRKVGETPDVVSKEPLEFEVTGNEAFQVVYKDGHFLFERPKREDGDHMEKQGKRPAVFRERPIEVQVKTAFPDKGPELSIALREQPAIDSNQLLPRPKFAIATLRPEKGSTLPNNEALDEVVVLADHDFSSDQHPTLTFPTILMGDAKKGWFEDTEYFQLDFWWSFDELETIDRDRFKTLEIDFDQATQERKIDIESMGQIQLARDGANLTVKRRMNKTDPLWFVLCPDAVQATRRYLQFPDEPGVLEEDLSFVIDPNVEKPKLLFLKEADLRRMAEREPQNTEGFRPIFHHRGNKIKLSQ